MMLTFWRRRRTRPFTSLSPQAQRQAVAAVARQLPTCWDSHHSDQLTATVTRLLATILGHPGGSTVNSIEATVWDDHRGRHLSLHGQLDRTNAPALPWHHGIDTVTLANAGRQVSVHSTTGATDPRTAQRLHHAVQHALATAWQAARDQVTTVAARQHALEWIAANQPRFRTDGTLPSTDHHPHPGRQP